MMLVQAEKEEQQGMSEACVSRTKKGWKQPTRRHSGVQNEPTHLGKGRRGWKEEAVSQRVMRMMLGHNINHNLLPS